MFAQWLASPTWVILLTLTLVFGATGLAMYRLSFDRRGKPRLASFAGIAPPFLSLPTVLFGLLASFLAGNVWEHARQAGRAVLDERDGALAIESIDQALPVSRSNLDALVHTYVRAVLDQEWHGGDERGSPAARAALQDLMREIARPEVAQEAGTSVQSALLAAASRIASARSTRLALVSNDTDEPKWLAVMCLAFVAQIGVAAVHLERPRAQAGAMAVFTAAAVIVLALIAVSENPFEGSHVVSPAPLRATLPP